MSGLFWLSEAQTVRLAPFFPKSHGQPRVDDGRVLSGIIFINRNGLRWRDAPAAYGPPKTLYNRWKRWSDKGVFARILLELSGESDATDTLMIDATHLKAHRTAASLARKRGARAADRPLQGRAEPLDGRRLPCNLPKASKLHTVTDAAGRPIRMYLSGGQTSDYVGARALVDLPPPANVLLADRGYDADWFRNALKDKGITPCIPSRKMRRVPIPHDTDLYKARHKIENSFARLKDWRRVAARYDRCPRTFLSAIRIAATVMFWL